MRRKRGLSEWRRINVLNECEKYIKNTFIHSITFIQLIYPSPLAEASLQFLIACLLSGETPPCSACRAENRTRACLTVSWRATSWVTPHHNCLLFSRYTNYKYKLSNCIYKFLWLCLSLLERPMEVKIKLYTYPNLRTQFFLHKFN